MSTSNYQILNIVTEAALESRLIKEVESLGAKGYTISDVRGKGSRGVRSARWEASSNIRIEIICDSQIAQTISLALKEKYYDDYAMVIFSHDVNVMRTDKF